MRLRSSVAAGALSALLGASLLVSGCGSAQAESGEAQTKVIKIGVGSPLTAGAAAMGQGIQRGAQLAVKQANENPDVKAAGIEFQIVAGDDQGDPKTGVTVANTFASDRNLIGVVGHQNSGVSIPAAKVYNDAKIVMVTPASTNPVLTQSGYENVFRVCTIDSVQGPVAADAAAGKLGFKTAVVVDDSTPYGEGLASEFAKRFQELGGTVVLTEKTSDKETDFNALATKIKATGADVVYYGGVYNAGALLSKQISESGAKAAVMGGDALYDPEYVKLAGDKAAGDLATSVGLPMDKMPKGQEFKAAYQAEYPGKELGAYDAYAYDAANVIIDATIAVAKAKGATAVVTPAGRTEIIGKMKTTSVEGVTGPIAFDANGDTTNEAITVYRVEGGEWKPFIVP